MPPVTLATSDIKSLKNTYKVLSVTDYVYLALRSEKDANSANQQVDADLFYTTWNIANSELFRQLGALETKKVLKMTPAQMTVTWSENPTTSTTQTEAINLKKDGLITNTTYVYYALALTKGAGLTQQVNPATYAASPWNIEASTLMNELNNLAAKADDITKVKLITLDLGTVEIIWLN